MSRLSLCLLTVLVCSVLPTRTNASAVCATEIAASFSHGPIFRAVFHAATSDGTIDFEDPETSRLMSVVCNADGLKMVLYGNHLEERQSLFLDRVTYVQSISQAPAATYNEMVSDFIADLNEVLGNGVSFRPALVLEIDEARSNMDGPGEVYFMALYDERHGQISFIRVNLVDGVAVQVTLAGAGSYFVACQGPSFPLAAARGISCDPETLTE